MYSTNLRKALASDKAFAEELTQIIGEIKEAGPNINIVLEIETAEEAVKGLVAKEMNKGNLKVGQKIKTAKGPVTGAKIVKIG